ncbi:MAG: RsiV family protein [Treponema sp.]|nr:RsiV family protein [Treponema sp.]
MKKYAALPVFALALLFCACVGAPPPIQRPQFTQRHYVFSVLLDPAKPDSSPALDLALTLLRMEFPDEQAGFLNNTLYSGAAFDEYKDKIVSDHRDRYRREAPADKDYNWRYSETASVKRYQPQGMVIRPPQPAEIVKHQNPGLVIERSIDSFSGGEHSTKITRFLNIDMEDLYILRIGDLFANFQEERRLRDIAYEELRIFGGLGRGVPLSQGIFFSNEPELTFNFFIADNGLGLHWDPGQIAPYSSGDIQVVLPWQIIRPMMLFPGIELLTKFNIHLFM